MVEYESVQAARSAHTTRSFNTKRTFTNGGQLLPKNLISNLHKARKMKDLELILVQGKLHTKYPAQLGRN